MKANDPEDDGGRDKALELAQENDHLLRLARAGAIDRAYRVDDGAWAGGRWLALRHIDGFSLWGACTPSREREGNTLPNRTLLLSIARSWATRLAGLHQAGWAHADVQPTNVLVTHSKTVEVIDYALCCGPDDDNRLPYRGALTHTTAPEIAALVLDTPDDVHVPAGPAADMWSLGASLFWCWTGHRPGVYAKTDERRKKLRALAARHLRDLASVRPWPFPDLEEMITACMAPDPEDRPTAEEMAAW
ncbi:protein kinase domain-containing protein [Streptomyces alanosinicus]|uniref:protein kinase domain-containing protein n=1 Tax=Streptomyces alanosinicus TaxID=68171 RepID=UPI001E52D074|nr:protein kinase [Streptomyces alanosinicus]